MQDRVYSGGIAQYYDRGKPNIEFEASLTKDLVYYIEGAIYNSGCTKEFMEQYCDWVELLCHTAGSTQIPAYPSAALVVGTKVDTKDGEKGYYDMMEWFKQKDIKYNREIIRPLRPMFIDFVFKYTVTPK